MKPQYLVQRLTPTNTLYGTPHLSDDSYTTLCGQNITAKFYLLNTDGSYSLEHDTCVLCLAELGKQVVNGVRK